MLALVLALAVSTSEPATAPVAVPIIAQSPSAPQGETPVLAAGTPVRLMITREVNSRTAKPGDQFKLRVDQAIAIGGAPLVPVGATAWAEIVGVEKNGVAGKSGRLNAKLLYLDLPSGRIPLRGDHSDRGKGNTTGVVFAVIGFGVLGLLNGGDSARLKAGDIVTGYIDGPMPHAVPASVVPVAPVAEAVAQ